MVLATPLPSGAAVPPEDRPERSSNASRSSSATAITRPGRLTNPANDARAVAAALWNVGFEVIEVVDADLGETLAAMTTFAEPAAPGHGGAVLYAGHAVQWNGANFLLPVSARVTVTRDLLNQAIDAGAIVRVMENAGARLNILILDSCRDNPFPAVSRRVRQALPSCAATAPRC